MRRAALKLLALEDRCTPAIINFTLTPATSTLSLGGTVNGATITQQGAGSLTTTYSGTVVTDVDFTAGTIEFLSSGSSMKANNSGTWQPAVGGGTAFFPGSAPANYGGQVTITGLNTRIAARGLVGAFDSAPLSLTGGPTYNFPSTQKLTLSAGTIDYNNLLLQGTGSLAGSNGPNAAAPGTLTDLGNGNYTLVMPGNATVTDTSSGFTVVLNITGTLNATATLPVVDLNGSAPGFNSSFTHIAGGAPSKIAPNATITRTPAANITSMTVSLTSQPDGTAEILQADLTGSGLSGTYNGFTGELQITGSGTLATYQTVLRSVTYANTSSSPTAGARPITVRVTDAGNSSLVRLADGKVETAAAAAKISGIQVNDGSAQRSMVTSLRVDFDSIVTFSGSPAAAFQLVRQADTAAVALNASVDNSGPGTKVTLSFSGGPVNGLSLADGRYTLTVLASQVNAGNFDGNGDGTAGDNYQLIGNSSNKLFRLFGDSDGNGEVSSTDFASLGSVFGQAGFVFDFDSNGSIDSTDFAAFGTRFGLSI